MGKRGPAPTPTAELKRRGSWRADLAANEPVAPEGTPECPDWLRPDAQAIWARVVPHLEVMGVLTLIDGEMLARYCQTWAKWRECEAFLEKNGNVYPIKTADRKDAEGNVVPGRVTDMKQYPQVNTAIKLADQLTRLEREFGMSPSSRAALGRTLPDKPQAIDPAMAAIQAALTKAN